MRSFAGSNSGEGRSALALAAVALAALTLSLLLAYVSTLPLHQRASGPVAVQTAPPARFGAPPTAAPAGPPGVTAAPPGAAPGGGEPQAPTLWALLTPAALVVDGLALLAIAAVLALRRALPRRRGARR